MCFRIKIADAIDFHIGHESSKPVHPKQVVVSFIMTNQTMYEQI